MKTILFLVAVMLFSSANAQEYRKFKAGLALGFANSTSVRAASLEAAYRINDRMAIGYRHETASLQSNSVYSKSVYYQIYFSGFHKKFRPFVSLGAGQFTPSTDMNGGCGTPHADRNVGIEQKIGIFTRVGFDVGHFSFSIDSNLAERSKSMVESNLQPSDAAYHDPYVQYLSNTYVAVKLGFFFGGGKKKVKNEALK